MKTCIAALFFFSALANAKLDLPWFANPDCVLGLDFKFEGDKDKNVMSGFHQDGLSRLFSFTLTEDKKYYVIFLQASEAPIKLSVSVSTELKNTNELSCRVTSRYGNGEEITRSKTKNIDHVLPVSQEAYFLCYDLIFTREFKSRPACG